MGKTRRQKLARWLILPFLFQIFLFSGALAALEEPASSHVLTPVCTMSGLKWIGTTPEQSDLGEMGKTAHCALCAVSVALPLDALPLTSGTRPVETSSAHQHRMPVLRGVLLFSHPPSHAPPIAA
jgi:hypothetical protein